MNKILKILSIFVMVFVLFSCANPSSDSTSGSQPSSPETPVETPSDDPVEETPEEPTYSITFIAEENPEWDTEWNTEWDKPVANLLNNLYKTKNLKKDEKVELPTVVYKINEENYTFTDTKDAILPYKIKYEANDSLSYEDGIASVVIKNERTEIKFYTTSYSD